MTVVGDRGNSQIRYGINNSLFQATIKNLYTYVYKNLVVSLRSHCEVKTTFPPILQILPHPWLMHLDTVY